MAQTSNKLNKLTNQELSIQISLSGLSFCILQRDTNTISYLKHFALANKKTPILILDLLQKTFNNEEALQDDFSNVTLTHVNELSTLVPRPLFDEANIVDYLKFNSKILKSDFIASDSIHLNDSVNVYVPYVNINNYIYDTFGSFSYKHFSTVLIEGILQIEKHAQNKKMYVHVSKNHFEIVVIDQGKLILYNSFEYSTKEDFIYYILFTTEQLQLNPETLNLLLIGDIDTKSELYTITHKYIRFVFFGDREDSYKYLIDAQPANYHSDFTLIKSL